MNLHLGSTKLLSALLILILFHPFMDLRTQERLIRPGDSIKIVVYGHEELSRTVTVSPGGHIDFPFVQNIPVDGITLGRLRELVMSQLSRYLDEAAVITVSYTQSERIMVNVYGFVAHPGVFQLPMGSRLQAAIEIAGDFMPGAKKDSVILTWGSDGGLQKAVCNLDDFLVTGDYLQNPVLHDGTMITLTGHALDRGVKVLGSVNVPGVYNPGYPGTILDMIFRAGGLSEHADTRRIKHISPKRSMEQQINLDDYYRSPQDHTLPTIQAGDILLVPAKKTSLWRRSYAVVRDLLIFAQFAYYYYLIQRVK